jgi:hypothetical protein
MDSINATNNNCKMRSSNSVGENVGGCSRSSAEEMDEKRQQNIAYEYLCHLEEAKKWIESCIREELPSTTECEENLRNGVYLAKLSNFFCPEKVPFKKIFDKDQSKFHASGLQFRHTDKINHWFNAMEHIGLPKVKTRSSIFVFFLTFNDLLMSFYFQFKIRFFFRKRPIFTTRKICLVLFIVSMR